MSELQGRYFDGSQSRGIPACLRWSAVATVVIAEDGRRINVDQAKLKVSSPLLGTPTRIAFGKKESFVTTDHAEVETLRRELALSPGVASRVERHMPAVLGAAVLVIALLATIGVWGVPALAARMAHTVSEDISAQMSAELLVQLDVFLQPSQIESERQQALTRYFNSYGEIQTIEFRDAGRFGANAVTLGMTMVAFSDDMVDLADSDEELLAVYFHELGHARLRHVEQNVFRGSAWLVFLAVLTGDAGAVGELLVSLPVAVALSAYSREFEREADAFAVDRLLEAGISPEVLASILGKLEDHHRRRDENSDAAETDDSGERQPILNDLLDYLASHPPTSERIAYIRSRMTDVR